MNSVCERRFKEEWDAYVVEKQWTAWDAEDRLREIREVGTKAFRKGNGRTQIREQLASRLRDPSRGIVLSYPEIAPLLGYRSHGSVIYAARRGNGQPAKPPRPIGMNARPHA